MLAHFSKVSYTYISSWYSKSSKILNTFFFLVSNEIMVIRAGIYKMFARKVNRGDPDQTASSKQSDLGLHCLSSSYHIGNLVS